MTVTEVTTAVRTTPHGSAPCFESAGGTSQLLPLCGWPPSFRALILCVVSQGSSASAMEGSTCWRWRTVPPSVADALDPWLTPSADSMSCSKAHLLEMADSAGLGLGVLRYQVRSRLSA